MIKLTSKYDPEPLDIILSSNDADRLDYFEGMDRLAVIERLSNAGKHYAMDWAINILIICAVVSVVCFIVDWLLGYPVDIERAVFCCVAFPVLAGLNTTLGIMWVLRAHREAVQVALNE